jgi:hypothetical protein
VFSRGLQAVDAGGDGGLQCARETDGGAGVGAFVISTIAVDYTALGQIPDDLLGEERVPGGLFRDLLGQPRYRRAGAKQLAD